MVVAEDRELVSIAEAARRFGVQPETIRNWISRKRIHVYKQELPQRTYVDAKEIERKRAIIQRKGDGDAGESI